MTDTAKTKFSNNLIAIAGLITAVGGLLTVLHQTGVVSFSGPQKDQTTINPIGGKEFRKVEETDPTSNDNLLNNFVPVSRDIDKVDTAFENLSGYWYDEINGGRYHFVHSTSGRLTFKEYSWMNGMWIPSAEGSGTIRGQAINLTYTTAYGLSGTFEGTMDEYGEEVAGFALDHSSGLRTNMHLSKQ